MGSLRVVQVGELANVNRNSTGNPTLRAFSSHAPSDKPGNGDGGGMLHRYDSEGRQLRRNRSVFWADFFGQ